MKILASSYDKKEKGIYLIDFDKKTLKFKLDRWLVTKDLPSYLNRKDNYLFASLKNSGSSESQGGLASYELKAEDIRLISHVSSYGCSYTHVFVNHDNSYILGANYHGGTTDLYKLNFPLVTKILDSFVNTGIGPDINLRQTSAHPHMVGQAPDGKYYYTVDLGADKIVVYTVKNEKLVEDQGRTVNLTPGSGPRHLAFDHSGRFAYVVCEISNKIDCYRYADGHFEFFQRIKAKPDHFKGENSASAIKITDSNNHLLVSNRGHNSLSFYRIDQENGELTLLYMVHTGATPRDFCIVDDKYVFAACQDANEIELFFLNETNETLVRSTSLFKINQPVCVIKGE